MKRVLCCAALLGLAVGLSACIAFAEPPAKAESDAVREEQRVSVAAARERAELMHSIYSATLDVMHDRYFHGDRSIVPARAMEDIFAELDRQSKVEARWISVNTQPMSVNHEPKSDFEKQAAKALAGGKQEFEAVEEGYYRRAGVIHLGDGCISCHTGFFSAANTKTRRFAGLVISVPVKSE
jgi:hypothetical protein